MPTPKKAATPKNALSKPVQPDAALAAVVGKDPLPRTELTKRLWEYIRKHELQDPKDKRSIRADEKLLAVFDPNFFVQNTVVNGINKAPDNTTHGEGSTTGQEVEITINFTTPIILPAGHYFFRPEVLLAAADGNFLYLSAPRPIVSPGTPFAADLQAWIRNSNLAPDWLRIGTDIIGGATPPTFNMTFSLKGETIPEAGTPGTANCHGKTISALAHQFGSIHAASLALGASSEAALQEAVRLFSEP